MSSSCRRLAVFSHFDPNGLVADYVLYSVDALRQVAEHIVVVSTSNLGTEERARISEVCDVLILRENRGYDFYSYKTGLESISLDRFEELILVNDSVFGPLQPLSRTFESMSREDVDFWGITDSYEQSYHLQSYFFVFRRQVIRSALFRDFWKDLVVIDSKLEIVSRYEVGLSAALVADGFRPAVVYGSQKTTPVRRAFRNPRRYWRSYVAQFKNLEFYRKVLTHFFRREGVNTSHHEWKTMLDQEKLIYLKVGLLRDNPEKLDNIGDALALIETYCDYPALLIRKHIGRESI